MAIHLLSDMFFLSPKRAKHFAAMVMIGDGVMALINPELDAKAWRKGRSAEKSDEKLFEELALTWAV